MNQREIPLTREEFIEDYTFLRENGENNAHAIARRMRMTHPAVMRRIFKYKLDHTGLLETGHTEPVEQEPSTFTHRSKDINHDQSLW